ncbi:MAG: hypothetical protein A2798_01790 [Candidatus Levybacteria bacterium RIFCSPHIGHO2_01_FULL_37_17]|nr:MAG: hypothetical protein A2798_01790 [Candidatus Levybacteria bacterium RIFCSPHIGHO2_01_FULL_37_17]OGH37180.1 MAG: hypothetical protein A2959_02650 [Candidatus Levybacteria bacterium RIFCSPLOWO2_01_FULL_38_23]
MKPNYLTLILTAVIVLIVLVGAYLFLSKGNTYAPTTQNEVTVIENPQDLNEANSALDSEDLDNIDSSLDQLDLEAASF